MEPLESTASAARAISRVKYTHDAMIDIILAKPDVSQNTLAEYFGYSTSWLSRILCSDAFQARLASRKSEIVTPGLLLTFEERLKALATQSLDMVMEKLDEVDENGKKVADIGTVFEALRISTKSLGYGARQANVAIQNNLTVNNISDEQLMAIARGEQI